MHTINGTIGTTRATVAPDAFTNQTEARMRAVALAAVNALADQIATTWDDSEDDTHALALALAQVLCHADRARGLDGHGRTLAHLCRMS
jgi:hypothetical protein